MRAGGRALVIIAVGFLALDAVLLIMAGVWSDRWALTAWGAGFGIAAFAVVALWRRYLRQLVDLDDARRALAGEIERLRRSAGLPTPTGRRAKLS
ncbi:MAG TPA: hypothetical protein VGI83_08170 [Gemmatimonadales bacterium]|jgi:membrane protein implicated in regulation of membrane protease activity